MLFKIGGRRPAREDEGGTIYSRYVTLDVYQREEAEVLIQEFKENGGKSPEGFAIWVNSETSYEARLLNDPIVSHALEHRDSDNKNASMNGGEANDE